MVLTSESTGGVVAVRASGLLPRHRPVVLQLTYSKQTVVDITDTAGRFGWTHCLADRHQMRDDVGTLFLLMP